jgi:hypothetical protein
MSTQNAKRMTTWMGSRYMGHSHGHLSANIPPTGFLIDLHLPTGSTDAVTFSPGESGGKEHLRARESMRTRRL